MCYNMKAVYFCYTHRKWRPLMETKHFTVSKIDGEYAYLVERESGEEIFIALALLPGGADVGDRLVLENLEFSFEI